MHRLLPAYGRREPVLLVAVHVGRRERPGPRRIQLSAARNAAGEVEHPPVQQIFRVKFIRKRQRVPQRVVARAEEKEDVPEASADGLNVPLLPHEPTKRMLEH